MNNAATLESRDSRLRVLFFVEGFTDIRFVVGLSEISQLTMIVPERQYVESGLKLRVERSGCQVEVIAIPGGRLAYQGDRSRVCGRWCHASMSSSRRSFSAAL